LIDLEKKKCKAPHHSQNGENGEMSGGEIVITEEGRKVGGWNLVEFGTLGEFRLLKVPNKSFLYFFFLVYPNQVISRLQIRLLKNYSTSKLTNNSSITRIDNLSRTASLFSAL